MKRRRVAAESGIRGDANTESRRQSAVAGGDHGHQQKGRRSLDRRPHELEFRIRNSEFGIRNSEFYSPAAVFLVFAGKISLNAVMNRAISSAVPIETRMCVVIGGNGRPTWTFFSRNSWITGWISRLMLTMKKFVSDGIVS